MPPKKVAAAAAAAEGGEAPTGLTDGELRFIKALFDNMTQKPDANWEQVAGDLGLKDAKCAKERFRQMSVRHGWRDGAGPTLSPRKSKNVAGGLTGDAKVKKTRSPRKKAAPAKKDEDEDEIKDEIKAEEEAKENPEVSEGEI
ncbi:ATPase-like, ATP-binding domain protein [Purpureocillium lavendulum]|uniref:ATPase-like, ATP-binding domain protein n=1 Tax=Purpureocillium lavendulum TaxID=1247861 RepID=A0AB34FTF2_9HYPO|nr:ATPase-like, ATP-binding domain protein [Purpureocillium lavendulum]